MSQKTKKESKPLTHEELLEACDVLQSLQSDCELQASEATINDHLSKAQREAKISFYKKQFDDIGHLIGTVQKLAEDALNEKEGASKEEAPAEGEIDFFIRSIAKDLILGVDWNGIQEMLGEDKQRPHLCALHPNIPSFPSPAVREYSFTEEEIMEILRRVNPHWMKEIYENGNLFEPIAVRYFAVHEPKSEGWLEVPGTSEN